MLRSACVSDVAPCCCSTSWLTTVMVCGVSSRSCVNFGDETRSTFGVSSASLASTEILDSVFVELVLSCVGAGACPWAAAAASAKLTATAMRES